MTKTKVKDGKKVEEKPLSKEKTMSQILIEQNQKMDELAIIPINRDPDFPPNWYKYPDLLYQEELKRWDSLNKENLSINELKERLIKAEILIEYELYTEHRLLQLYVEGRITIKKAMERDIKAKENKTIGRRKQIEPKKIKAKEIFDEVVEELKSMNPEGWRLFKLRVGKEAIPESSARNYWKEFTGFDSVKNSQDLSNEID
jgi:hypothetical protein